MEIELEIKTTTEAMIEAVKIKTGYQRDGDLAKYLRVSPPLLSHWRRRRAFPNGVSVLRMARELGANPGFCLAIVEAERAVKDGCLPLARVWRKIAMRELDVLPTAKQTQTKPKPERRQKRDRRKSASPESLPPAPLQ